jgi:hypothetical protein
VLETKNELAEDSFHNAKFVAMCLRNMKEINTAELCLNSEAWQVEVVRNNNSFNVDCIYGVDIVMVEY